MGGMSQSLSSEPFTRLECLGLLERADVARVLLSLGSLPAAMPARIELVEHDHLVISSRANAVLVAARRGDVISVQIDGLGPDNNLWSVTVTGIAASAPPNAIRPERAKRPLDPRATLILLPLSVVRGQREH
jgi:hypothetical protein